MYLEFNVSNAWDWNPECQHKANHRGTRLVSNAVDRGAVFSAEVTGIARVFFVVCVSSTVNLSTRLRSCRDIGASALPKRWRFPVCNLRRGSHSHKKHSQPNQSNARFPDRFIPSYYIVKQSKTNVIYIVNHLKSYREGERN